MLLILVVGLHVMDCFDGNMLLLLLLLLLWLLLFVKVMLVVVEFVVVEFVVVEFVVTIIVVVAAIVVFSRSRSYSSTTILVSKFFDNGGTGRITMISTIRDT